MNPISIRLRVYSHQKKAGAKAKAMKEQEKKPTNIIENVHFCFRFHSM